MDFARRKKLDSNAQRNAQQGSDPMDVGAVGNDWGYGAPYYGGEEESEATSKGKGKKGGKGAVCYSRGGKGHVARDCPKEKGRETTKVKEKDSKAAATIAESVGTHQGSA